MPHPSTAHTPQAIDPVAQGEYVADPRLAILGRLGLAHRDQFKRAFLGGVRDGEGDPKVIVTRAEGVLNALADEAGANADDAGWWAAFNPLVVLHKHRDEAEDFARYCVEWVRLPREERERRKAVLRAEHRRTWGDTPPATPKQIAYCRRLGYRGAIEGRAHASAIIDSLRSGGRV